LAGSRPPAFILGLGVNGYGILRSLAREGVRAVGFYTDHEEFGRFSKHCEACFLPASLDEREICRVLIEHGERAGGKPVLFPTSDYHSLLLAKYRDELSRHFHFHWVEEQSLRCIVDKARMSSICRQAGLAVPRTHVTQRDENLAELAAGLSFPCLVKPSRSFDCPFPAGLKNFVAGSPDELLAFYRAHPELKGTTVCQEIIEGGDENMFEWIGLVDGSGEARAEFCARKLRQYPPGYGVMCFGRSEHNAVLSAQSLPLVRSLRYRGLGSIEFKYRPEDGRYYFIEMNPRLSWFSALFADAGVNFAYLAYLELTQSGSAEPVRARQRHGVHWINFRLDLKWFARARSAGVRVGLLAWLRSAARARSFAWFDWRDPKPFLRQTMPLFAAGVRRLFRASLVPNAKGKT
jgi:predicted ATP-grasp superfamily ATP-dependent carboligase